MGYRDILRRVFSSARITSHAALVFGLMLLTAGCEQPLPEVDSPEAALYMSKCGVCHAPPHPQVHTFKAWKKVVPIMERRVEATGVRPLLSEEETANLLSYLKKHARKSF